MAATRGGPLISVSIVNGFACTDSCAESAAADAALTEAVRQEMTREGYESVDTSYLLGRCKCSIPSIRCSKWTARQTALEPFASLALCDKG